MKLLSLVFGLSLFSSSVLSHPFDLPFTITQDEMETLERRQSGHILTKGASGDIQPRLEIRQMETQQPDQFTLLLLAMQKFQARSQGDSTSYYQISGIHGVPRQSWNGVGECSSCQGADGYCTHDSVLFPAWHRAYMALFEQEFISVAKGIANSWPSSGRAQMQAAANTIRWPYWDWAAAPPGGGNNLPDSTTASSIVVNGPNGQQTIANPLYSHHFTDPKGLVYSPFFEWQNTVRYPTSDAASAASNEGACISAFNSIRGSLQDQLYKLLTSCSDYLHFSNDDAGSSSAGCANSLEGLHNTIHTTAGGVPSSSVRTAGHMYYLSTAAFDPLFWLHHSNVDRIFALWQTLHSSYGASQVAPHSTWTIAAGSTQNADSPLMPFYKSGSTFWTTNTVKDWTVFRYTYPEFANGGGKSAVAKAVNNLYGPGAKGTAGSSKRGLFDLPIGALAQNGSAFEYIANIQAPRYALNGTYLILLFLGSPKSEDCSTWFNDDNLVGPMGVLSQPNMNEKEVTISGSIPLTRTLTEKLGSGLLSELTEALVGPFLQSLLQWRILGPDGDSVDPDSVPGFLVSVFSTTATNPESDDSLPDYSEFVPLPIATHGKKGGLLGLEGLDKYLGVIPSA